MGESEIHTKRRHVVGIIAVRGIPAVQLALDTALKHRASSIVIAAGVLIRLADNVGGGRRVQDVAAVDRARRVWRNDDGLGRRQHGANGSEAREEA